MDIPGVMMVVAATLALLPVWRLPTGRFWKLLASASLAVMVVAAVAGNSYLLLACVVVLACGFYLLWRSWLADRAEMARLRATAQRNADQISVVSHEIRTPLALVRGAADLLAEETPGPLNQQQRRFVDTISGNCTAVVALAEDLLVQARIDAGIFKLHLQRVNLRRLAGGVVAELRRLHSVDISLDCPGAPPRIWADADLLRQALTNLINNAVVHAHAATLVTVRIVSTDEDVLVSVSDNGRGMTREVRQRLFERFASGRPLRDGTGLGLVITRQIIQMHGGDVLVDSTPNRGTTMLFSIPNGQLSPQRETAGAQRT